MPTIENSTFERNTASLNGGAIRLNLAAGVQATFRGCSFVDNVSNPSQALLSSVGGAIWLEEGDLTIVRSSFARNRSATACTSGFGQNCTALARGGALFADGGTVRIENSEFTENQVEAINRSTCGFGGQSVARGAAVYVHSGTVAISNSILGCSKRVTSNCGPSAAGLGLYVDGGAVEVVNSVIARNSTSTGVAQIGGMLSVTNSILYFNNANGAQVGGTPQVTYSNVQSGYEGTGNINVNPVLAGTDCTIADSRILLGSPSIDAGNPDVAFNDQCFPPSLGGVRNDMGAFGGATACDFAP
jgi:hypothetical protein